MDFNKYFGEKKYKIRQMELKKKYFTDSQKTEMLLKMSLLIKEKDFKLYHNFMDYISENNEDWFNLLTFDRKSNKFILTYIKSRVQASKRGKN